MPTTGKPRWVSGTQTEMELPEKLDAINASSVAFFSYFIPKLPVVISVQLAYRTQSAVGENGKTALSLKSESRYQPSSLNPSFFDIGGSATVVSLALIEEPPFVSNETTIFCSLSLHAIKQVAMSRQSNTAQTIFFKTRLPPAEIFPVLP